MPEYAIRSTAAYSDERRLATLRAIRDQHAEIGPSVKGPQVSCGDCGRRKYALAIFRCRECNVMFCALCADVHFGITEAPTTGGKKA